MTDPVALATAVLAADGQPFATLSLAPSLAPVTVDTPVPEARRNYMRLAGLIHPDKIKSAFDKSTEAFQCLVRAFECFADPKARKAAAVKPKKKGPAKGKASQSPVISQRSAPSHKKASQEAAKPSKAAPQTKKKKKRSSDSDEDEHPSEDDDDEDDTDSEAEDDDDDASSEDSFGGLAAEDEEPTVSTSRAAIGQPRTGGAYVETTIGCPNCRTRWEPDAKQQYSLFMGPWGKRVHCQLCLFVFGSATALHGCPHCTASLDYDASMYEADCKCTRCKKDFGFAYFPVNQHLIDQVAYDDWRDRKERERGKEREARARARHGGDEASEELVRLTGACVVEERCPLCSQRVKSRHRAHVEECLKLSPEERKGSGKKTPAAAAAKKPAAKRPPAKATGKAVKSVPSSQSALSTTSSAGGTVAKKTAAAPKRTAPAAPQKKAPAPKAGKKRRRAGSSSDEDDDSDASFDSGSESSADEDDSDYDSDE